jgi:CBS domain-containing protein
MMKVAQVMQREVVSVRPQDTIRHLDEVLCRHRITGVPVLDGEQVVGVVSRSDVVRQLEVERSRFEGSSWYLEPFDVEDRTPAHELEVSEAIGSRLARLRVHHLMAKEILLIDPETSLPEAARAMVEQRVHRLLVMADGKLVGLVSSLDLLRGFAAPAAASDAQGT